MNFKFDFNSLKAGERISFELQNSSSRIICGRIFKSTGEFVGTFQVLDGLHVNDGSVKNYLNRNINGLKAVQDSVLMHVVWLEEVN